MGMHTIQFSITEKQYEKAVLISGDDSHRYKITFDVFDEFISTLDIFLDKKVKKVYKKYEK